MNNSNNFLKIHKELEKIARKNKTTTKKTLQDFLAYYDDFLALELKKEYEKRTKTYGVKQICEKYEISMKTFYKLIKTTGAKIQKRRNLKSTIREATQELNLTQEEYIALRKYFDKREISSEKVVEKLHKIRE